MLIMIRFAATKFIFMAHVRQVFYDHLGHIEYKKRQKSTQSFSTLLLQFSHFTVVYISFTVSICLVTPLALPLQSTALQPQLTTVAAGETMEILRST